MGVQVCLIGGAVLTFKFKRLQGFLRRSQLCDSHSLVAGQPAARPSGDVPPSCSDKVY